MIRVVQADLAGAAAEAVVCPATAEWNAVTPATRRVELAAGAAPHEQARRLGELPVGSAIITVAGDLSAQYMIHVIVRSHDQPVTESGVRRGLDNVLRRIAEWGIQHVAMPPLGTGAGNLDAEDAAAIMVPTLADRLREGGPPQEVDIFVDSTYDFDVFTRHVQRMQGP